jgi:hypothetical protein
MAENLLDVLRQTRRKIAQSQNFVDSHWSDRAAALAEFEALLRQIGSGVLPKAELDVLFAPTGALRQLSVSNGWAYQFLVLASRYEAAIGDTVQR